jgi:ubiquinone/menaquinone biosynthesis C-methylase UbiE
MSQPATGDQLPSLYRLDRSHWWSSGMRGVTHALLEGIVLPPGLLVEVGCGAGNFLRELAARHPSRTVLGVEIHAEALSLATEMQPASNGPDFLAGDVQRLPLPDRSCALVVTLDVLDQSGVTPGIALAECHRVLGSDGLLLARVSAYDWLRGPHDVAFGTSQRYTAASLRRVLSSGSFAVLRSTYANSLLLPLAVAVRLAERAGGRVNAMEQEMPPAIEAGLRQTLRLETRWLHRRNLPAGLSLYVLARPVGQDRRATG